jgi:hypothetical protein
MAFRLRIQQATHLKTANVWLIEGTLEDGQLDNDVTAVARTSSGDYPIHVKNVAFVETPSVDPNDLTLVIERPPCALNALEGALLISNCSG